MRSNQPCQFSISMLGGRDKEQVQEFWDHFLQVDGWKHHPAFSNVEAGERGRTGLSCFNNGARGCNLLRFSLKHLRGNNDPQGTP